MFSLAWGLEPCDTAGVADLTSELLPSGGPWAALTWTLVPHTQAWELSLCNSPTFFVFLISLKTQAGQPLWDGESHQFM